MDNTENTAAYLTCCPATNAEGEESDDVILAPFLRKMGWFKGEDAETEQSASESLARPLTATDEEDEPAAVREWTRYVKLTEHDRRMEVWRYGTIKRGAAIVKAVRWGMDVDWQGVGNWAMGIALAVILFVCPLILGS